MTRPRTTASTKTEVEIDGRTLSLSNLPKVLYPDAGFTKAQVIDYYIRISAAMVPHLRGRPMTLKRYPDGVNGQFFYEKNCPSHRPDWVKTAPVWSGDNGRDIDYCLVGDLATLTWLANLAAIELHPLLARAPDVQCPTMIVFDLDPGPPAGLVECSRVAIQLRELFSHLGLEAFAKTSGSKGMQVYVPLNTPATYAATKTFARAVAQLLERQQRAHVVSSMAKALRPGKVFIDWSQNDEHKTTIGVYSLRARPRPTVSTPVAWDEIEAVATTGDAEAIVFEGTDVLARVERLGDLFAPTLELRQVLPEASKLTL